MVASVQAAACLGLSHRITWSDPVCFSQSVSGLQTPHDVEVTAGAGVSTSSFSVDVLAAVTVFGLEVGEPVTLSVTSAGAPVGSSPYQEPSFAPGIHLLELNPPCGVVLAPGSNQLTVDATDTAGNPATPATMSVTYTP